MVATAESRLGPGRDAKSVCDVTLTANRQSLQRFAANEDTPHLAVLHPDSDLPKPERAAPRSDAFDAAPQRDLDPRSIEGFSKNSAFGVHQPALSRGRRLLGPRNLVALKELLSTLTDTSTADRYPVARSSEEERAKVDESSHDLIIRLDAQSNKRGQHEQQW
jgi:hypothetical protein